MTKINLYKFFFPGHNYLVSADNMQEAYDKLKQSHFIDMGLMHEVLELREISKDIFYLPEGF